jgi:hypothetical protein
MITLSQVSQYARDNNLSDSTDIFSILSKMWSDYMIKDSIIVEKPTLTTSKVEYSTQDVLDLFST